MGEDVVGGGKGRRVQVRAARGARKAEPKRQEFTAERKERFLAHFAATCNAKAAARAAGVAFSTVYVHRKADDAFRTAWNEALAQGYAQLEADLVRRAMIVPRVRADNAAMADNMAIDAKTALAILESYRRNGERRPGEILAQPYDLDEVRDRLEAKMRALGMLGEGSDGVPQCPLSPTALPLDGGGLGGGEGGTAAPDSERLPHPNPSPSRGGASQMREADGPSSEGEGR